MNKTDVVKLIKKVDAFYPGRMKMDDPRDVINAWHEALKDSKFEASNKKLLNYVKKNKFPPTVADLISNERKKPREQLEHEELVRQMQERLNQS